MNVTKSMERRMNAVNGKWHDEGDGYGSLVGYGGFSTVAYISLPEGHPDIGTDYNNIGDYDKEDYGPDVNGGLTYSEENVFGWDYGHYHNPSSPEVDIPEAIKYFKAREKSLI